MEKMSPDEKVFRSHLEGGTFQSGADRGRWQLKSINWPYVVIGVSATKRAQAPDEYTFRFELGNYPVVPPTAQPWDEKANGTLAHNRWPSGQGRVSLAFNPGWKGGSCLYLPCDRNSIEGHDGWKNQHPELIWNPSSDVTQYLWIIYDLLHSEDYTGIRCP
jgi:hypothetical protein